jgi:hypothetical protein
MSLDGTDGNADGSGTSKVLVGLLGGLLVLGTAFGVVQALGDTSTDRVAPGSTAPVYGTP